MSRLVEINPRGLYIDYLLAIPSTMVDVDKIKFKRTEDGFEAHLVIKNIGRLFLYEDAESSDNRFLVHADSDMKKGE